MRSKTQTFIGTAAEKTRTLMLRFLVRFLFWSTIIAVLAGVVGEALWPYVYKLYGLPLGIGKEGCYQAVLFGDLVSAVMGGAAVAFVGTFRKH